MFTEEEGEHAGIRVKRNNKMAIREQVFFIFSPFSFRTTNP